MLGDIITLPLLNESTRETTGAQLNLVTSFGRASFSYSAVQPPFDINFPWSLGLPGLTISLPVLYAAKIWHPGISNLQHHPLRVPIHTLAKWSLGDSFIVPREIHAMTV